jgi:hypothetical protein
MGLDRDEVLYITTADGTTLGVLEDCEVTISAETISSRETVLDADGLVKTKVSNRIEEPPVITITGKMVDWDASIHVKIV